MIRDDIITYGESESFMLSWAPGNPILNGVLVATFNTIISYQLTALIIDIGFSWKHRGKTKASDLLLLLLIRHSSPVQIYRALFKTTKNLETTANKSKGPPNSLALTTIIKLAVLLLVAPIANIIAIFLALESDPYLTFSEAGFGGIALGVSENPTVVFTSRLSNECRSMTLSVRSYETPLVDFVLCLSHHHAGVLPQHRDVASLEFMALKTGEILMNITTNAGHISLMAEARILESRQKSTGRINFRLASHVDETAIEAFMNPIIKSIQIWCAGDGPFSAIRHGNSTRPMNHNVKLQTEMTLECSRVGAEEDLDWFARLVDDVSGNITFVESETALVYSQDEWLGSRHVDQPTFEPADNLPLLRRTRPYAPFYPMFLVMVGVVTARSIARLFMTNDVARGIGLYVRKLFEVPCGDTLLLQRDICLVFSEQRNPEKQTLPG